MPGNSILLDGLAPANPSPPPTGGGNVTPGPYSQASIATGSPTVGTAPLAGSHNAILHVAAIGLLSAAGIIVMHKLGFHLISVGRYRGGG